MTGALLRLRERFAEGIGFCFQQSPRDGNWLIQLWIGGWNRNAEDFDNELAVFGLNPVGKSMVGGVRIYC
jgi:hypothetical protein